VQQTKIGVTWMMEVTDEPIFSSEGKSQSHRKYQNRCQNLPKMMQCLQTPTAHTVSALLVTSNSTVTLQLCKLIPENVLQSLDLCSRLPSSLHDVSYQRVGSRGVGQDVVNPSCSSSKWLTSAPPHHWPDNTLQLLQQLLVD